MLLGIVSSISQGVLNVTRTGGEYSRSSGELKRVPLRCKVSSLTALTRLTHLSMCRNPLGKACFFTAQPPTGSAAIERSTATGLSGGCFGRLTTLLLDECGISKLHRLQLDCLSGKP